MGDNSKMGTEISEIGESSQMEGRSEMEGRSGTEGSQLKQASGVLARPPPLPFGDKKLFLADETSTWYQHLSRGRCAELLSMLEEDPSLLRQKGKGNVTVLHKAVQHRHVELVRYVLSMFDSDGISTHFGNQLTLEDLLCEKNDREVTAVMLAATVGPWEGMYLLDAVIELCDYYHKTEADKLDTTGCQTNCSGIVEEYLLNDLERYCLRNLGAVDRFVVRRPEYSFHEQTSFHEPTRGKSSRHQDEIEPIVKDVLENDYNIRELKEAFNRRDDYNSLPIEAVFFHFLCGCCEIQCVHGYTARWKESAARVAKKIVDKIKDHPDVDSRGSLMFDLFDYLDPRGRTPLHVAGMAGYEVQKEYKFVKCGSIIGEVLKLIPSGEEYDRCVNVRDGSGRTIFHQACILKNPENWHHILKDNRVNLDARVDLDARVNDARLNRAPKMFSKREERTFGPLVHRLLYWRSPGAQYKSLETWLEDIPPEDLETEYSNLYPTGLHLLILYGHEDMLEHLLKVKGQLVDVNARLWRGSLKSSLTPVQLAAALGHTRTVEMLLKHKEVKDLGKLHVARDESDRYSVIHVAAAYKRLKVLQTILGNKEIYDPMITKTSAEQESPLHLVALTRKLPDPIMLEDILLEGDMGIVRRCLNKYEDLANSSLQNNYDANDIVCINIILQVGFDIWNGDKDGREPYPGVDATIESYKWWYERVAQEILNYKQKFNGAMGAISVVATLVATASFIGPLQPPLGYDGNDGYVHSSYMLIRVYFVCNGLSFYFAVASILAAITPTIPMLRESTQDEIRRSQRNSKIAISLLLISIIAILISFSCSSIVVMSPLYGHDRGMMFYTVGVGATICIVILVVFILRMIGQIFNQPDLVKNFLLRRGSSFSKRLVVCSQRSSFLKRKQSSSSSSTEED